MTGSAAPSLASARAASFQTLSKLRGWQPRNLLAAERGRGLPARARGPGPGEAVGLAAAWFASWSLAAGGDERQCRYGRTAASKICKGCLAIPRSRADAAALESRSLGPARVQVTIEL